MSIRIDINVCRVCCKAEAPHSILKHAAKFQYCTALQISEQDGLPTKICDGCLGRMRVAVEFKRKSESSDRHLRSFIDKVNSQFHLALGGGSDGEEDGAEDIDEGEEQEEKEVLAEVPSSVKIPMCTIPGKQEEVEQEVGGTESDPEPKQELEKFRAVAVIQEKPATPPPPPPLLVKPERDEIDIVELEYEDEIPLEDLEAEEQEQQEEAEEELIYIDLPAGYQQHQEEEDLVQPMEESGHESIEVYEIQDDQSSTLEIPQSTPKRRHQKTPKPKSDSEKSTSSRFECLQCRKIFSTRTNLNRHLLTHDGNKPYTCLLCHKGFTQSGSLKQHLLIHQNLRPYVCTECGQGFTQQKSLTFHMRRHTNEKPFICSFCGYAFRQKDGLKRHVAVKHNENSRRDFGCDLCAKAFQTKHALAVHRKRHNGGGDASGTDKEGEAESGSREMVVTVVGEIDE